MRKAALQQQGGFLLTAISMYVTLKVGFLLAAERSDLYGNKNAET